MAFQVDDYTLLIDDTYIVTGDSLLLEEEVWTVYGQTVSEVFQMTWCDFKTEGETYIDARLAPSAAISIKLEGQSEAVVWPTEILTGKAEGSAILHYVYNPFLDISGFTTEGNAQVLPLLAIPASSTAQTQP